MIIERAHSIHYARYWYCSNKFLKERHNKTQSDRITNFQTETNKTNDNNNVEDDPRIVRIHLAALGNLVFRRDALQAQNSAPADQSTT